MRRIDQSLPPETPADDPPAPVITGRPVADIMAGAAIVSNTGNFSQHACHARLALQFADDRGTTRLVSNEHFGPLRVQKALYPEQPAVCHAIIVHPPGGVVGGDQLDIDVDLGARASALLTTPGATKWYRAHGTDRHPSQQRLSLRAGERSTLEWLPQETIFFNDSEVELDTTVELAAGAQYIGCETLCFGRTASGEQFNRGRVAQRLSIRLGGKLVWYEQGVLLGDGAGMHSVMTLAGKTVCATLVAVATSLPPGLLAGMREQLAQEFGAGVVTGFDADGKAIHEAGYQAVSATHRGLDAGDMREQAPGASAECAQWPDYALTYMKPVFMARYLGDSGETAKQLMTRVWQLLRPAMLGRDAVIPRIWNT